MFAAATTATESDLNARMAATETNLNAQMITTEAAAAAMEVDLDARMAAMEAAVATTEADLYAWMATAETDLVRRLEDKMAALRSRYRTQVVDEGYCWIVVSPSYRRPRRCPTQWRTSPHQNWSPTPSTRSAWPRPHKI